MITPVILCGGSGTRLWPLSRDLYPKQLLALTGEQTLLQQTILRLERVDNIGAPIIICNEEHRFLVAEQLRQIEVNPEAIILEPMGRDTAPATALAALHMEKNAQHSLMLVLPADHLIKNREAFHKAVESAEAFAEEEQLVTFGIVPSGPETGYGYIKRGAQCTEDGENLAYQIEGFVEKPDVETAASYIADGNYSWNSGMFLFKPSTFLGELREHNELIYSECKISYESSRSDLDFLRVEETAFGRCPSDSIDYAVMEKTTNGIVLPIDIGWNDIGSWSALWDIGTKDENSNVVHGDVMLHETQNSFIHSDDRLVAAIGLQGLVIVDTTDALLVADKNCVQDVKKVVTLLRKQNRQEANLHNRVFRPWGSYECIKIGDRFQVKLITVKSGAILSLQMHHHRAEHWIVVKGTATITKGNKEFSLSENESTYIPIGETHRLENPGVIPLELIEVQSGSYLGEDDIVRFEDSYGRLQN